MGGVYEIHPTTMAANVKPASKSKASLLNAVGYKSLITFTVLALAWLVGFASRLFAVIRFESIIHEFDPWFNYRATANMVQHGFYNFLNWFDERAWYPLGRIVGGTVYQGLMVTSGFIHWFLNSLHITVNIRNVCVFLAPLFSGLTAISTFFLTRELWDSGAALFAACFISIVPGYISRSVAGSYDNEGIAIFALQFTYFLWIRSLKSGSVFWAICTAVSYFYMVSAWGGYVFIINLIPLHVFTLLLMSRFTRRLYVAYTTFFIMGLLLSMQIPFVGFQPIRTSEHMASLGVFGLLQAYCLLDYLKTKITKSQFKTLFSFALLVICGVLVVGVVALTWAGYIAPWSGRFYSLWDTGYAKIHIPIIASVSEHQPTTWSSFFFDLHILSSTFPVGLWYVIKNINDERVFIVLYACSAVYFAGVMVRLMLTLTPVVCVLSAIAFSRLLQLYLKEEETTAKNGDSSEDESPNEKGMYDKAGKLKKMKHEQLKENEADQGLGVNVRSFVIVAVMMMLMMFAVHCTWVTSNAYSSPSIVLASYGQDGTRQIIDDFREAYYWLWQNTPDDSRVMSWWDYGYQIAGMANRTTLVDNNTWNNSHIALVGKAMSSNETAAYKIMTDLNVDYVLVIFGGVIGFSGDDINKFLWMVRIAEGEHPKDIQESNYFSERGEFRVDSEASQTMLNCLMYKLSYYRFGDMKLDFRNPAGYDRTRNAVIGRRSIDLTYLEEAYTSEHWLVRIYRVKKPHEFNRPNIDKKSRRFLTKPNYVSKKTNKKRKGFIKNRPVVIRGKRSSDQ